MTELEAIFAELGISHYLTEFIEQGFDSWDTILDITESDFDALGVKLGHRRKLQRKIANSRGLSPDRALASPTRNTPTEDRPVDEQKTGTVKAEGGKDAGSSSSTQGAKRKYRRHPKPDENAPDRPPSAYVIFSNKMREELRGRNLSFTEIAKLVGENWQSLLPTEKEPYEQQAFTAKERYNAELSEYKKTSEYTEYTQYLLEFKARQSNPQQSTSQRSDEMPPWLTYAVADPDATKRPKLENYPSTGSTGTVSSTTSQNSRDTSRIADSSPASTSQWAAHESHHATGMTLPTAQSTGSPSSAIAAYHGSIFSGISQSLPWREHSRQEHNMPIQQRRRVSSIGDRPSAYPGASVGDPLNLTDALQHARGVGQGPQASAPGSSQSTNSSAFLTPRTPLEPTLDRDRALPIPSIFPQASPGSYENQLPPLRASSLSPQSGAHRSLPTPNSTLREAQLHPNLLTSTADVPGMEEFPTAMAPMRGHPSTNSPHGDNNDPRIQQFGSAEDNNLDPVSALLRAGEIVNRNSRGQPRS